MERFSDQPMPTYMHRGLSGLSEDEIAEYKEQRDMEQADRKEVRKQTNLYLDQIRNGE